MTTGGKDTGNSHEDELLTHIYQQVTDREAAQHAATYDADAGLARFKGWLQEHTSADEDQAHHAAPDEPGNAADEDPSANTTPSSQDDVDPIYRFPPAKRRDATKRPSVTGTGTELAAASGFSIVAVATAIRASVDAIPIPFRPMPARLEMTAGEAVTQLYMTHYRSLVRLAVLLVRDEPTAEEVVQECFIAMHDGWHRLRDEDKALSYLKQAVVNRSGSVLRHRNVVDRNVPKPAPDMPGAEQGAASLLERSAVITALRELPDRQRQALVLRYYADMPEAQIAEMMEISKSAVRSHTARGMASLRSVLEQAT
jgi:RNA polymerase sigma-70 factor (sigma-E family)